MGSHWQTCMAGRGLAQVWKGGGLVMYAESLCSLHIHIAPPVVIISPTDLLDKQNTSSLISFYPEALSILISNSTKFFYH